MNWNPFSRGAAARPAPPGTSLPSPAPPRPAEPESMGVRLIAWLQHWKLPLLALSYVFIYLLIDTFVENIIRYYIFCIFLVVSSLYFSWYLGGKETMLYVAFFNIFFAFIFSRLLYLSGGGIVDKHLFLGRSFLVLYAICILFMTIMIGKKSPADVEQERREQNIREERKRRNQLELMVASQKLTHDLIKQANLVKDELLLLKGAWRSQIHSIINDLPRVKEQELYNQIVAPFQESIISHLRSLETRLSFSPAATDLEELRDFVVRKYQEDRVCADGRVDVRLDDEEWRGRNERAFLDVHKTWEILLNLTRNSQSAMELKQIDLLKNDRAAYAAYRPRLEVEFVRDGGWATISVADNGGGMDEEQLALLFREPLPSRKRGGKTPGQGTIFVKFFGESMGMDIQARNTHRLGDRGLLVELTMPLLAPADATPEE